MDPYLLFAILGVPGGGGFLAAWSVLMILRRKRREPKPGGPSRFRRVVLGNHLMAFMILAGYTCGLVVGIFLLTSTMTTAAGEYGF